MEKIKFWLHHIFKNTFHNKGGIHLEKLGYVIDWLGEAMEGEGG